MPRSTPRKSNESADQKTLLPVQDLIENWLRKMLAIWPQKELTPGEIEDWIRDLKGFPPDAINYAFENWRRSGRWFPDYGPILDMCMAWQPEPKYRPGCSKECLPRHGKGYHSNDMLWLFRRMCQEVKAGRTINPEALLTELDSKREGGAPSWRRA